MSKTNYAAIVDGSKFNAALKSVFTGIAAKQDQIQQLILAAVSKAQQSNDFDWLSRIAVQIELTRGLNLKLFADWVKAHIVQTDGDNAGKPALDWQDDKKSFKLAAKGINWHCKPISLKWYEMGKPAKMEDVYSLVGSIEKLLATAAGKAKKGGLSAADTELLNRIAGSVSQYKTEQMAAKMEAQAADPASF